MSSISDRYKEFDANNENEKASLMKLQEERLKSERFIEYNNDVETIKTLQAKMKALIEGPNIYPHTYVKQGQEKVVCWEIDYFTNVGTGSFPTIKPSTYILLLESGNLVTANDISGFLYKVGTKPVPNKILNKINIEKIDSNSKLTITAVIEDEDNDIESQKIFPNGIHLLFGTMRNLRIKMEYQAEKIFGIKKGSDK